MSKAGTSAPAAINTGQLTQQTAQASAEAAAQQAQLSNIDTSSPLGTSNFTPVGTGPGGIGPDHYTLDQTLGSQTQPVYNTQTQLAQLLAQQGVNAAGLIGSPVQAGANIVDNAFNGLSGALPNGGLNLNGLTALPSSSSDFSNEVTNAGNAAYNTQEAYLQPQQQEQSSDFAQQMADQGIAPGSPAYSRASGDLSRAQTFANQQAQNAAVTAGDQEQSQLYGENLSSRQEGVNEALQQYQAPINALGSLAGTGEGILSGAASQLPSLDNLANFTWASGIPTFGGGQSTLSSPNVPGAAGVAAQSALNSFSAGNALNSQLGSTIGSLGGALGLSNGGLGSALGLSGVGGLLGSQGPLFGTAADASIASGGAPLALDAAGAGASAWIICTELMRQGRMPKRHWIAGSPIFAGYPEVVKRGYYAWAIPAVRHLRAKPQSLYSRALAKVFGWRAENIAATAGVTGARKLWRGALVTAVLWPTCTALGVFIGEQNWQSVYPERQI